MDGKIGSKDTNSDMIQDTRYLLILVTKQILKMDIFQCEDQQNILL